VNKGDTPEDMPNFSAFATFVEVEKFAYVTKNVKDLAEHDSFWNMTLCGSPRLKVLQCRGQAVQGNVLDIVQQTHSTVTNVKPEILGSN
jgi:hypothetical protein